MADPLATKSHMKILGIKVDSRGTTHAAVVGGEVAAMAVWFRGHRWFCRKRIPSVGCLDRLCATVGAASIYSASG